MTLVYGILKVDCVAPLGPLPTVRVTTFEPPPEKLCAPELEGVLVLVLLLLPPPQATSSDGANGAI